MRRLFPWIFALACAVFPLFFWPAAGLHENAADLLPAGPGRDGLALLADAGMLDRVMITVRAGDPATLAAAIDACGRGLGESGRFRQVLYRLDGAAAGLAGLVARNLPYLLRDEDYRRLARFRDPAILDRRMARLFLFLNSPEGFAVSGVAALDPLGLVPAVLARYAALGSGMDLVVENGRMLSRDRGHGLVIAESRAGLTDSAGVAGVAETIGRIRKELAGMGAEMTVTGPLPHTLANRAAVRRDLALLLPLASVALVVLLRLGCSSAAGPLLFLVPVLAAPAALVFAARVNGRLSAIAAGFGIVLLGIGVDFAIHLFFARRDGNTAAVIRPVTAPAATTLGCFAILLFSAIPVHRQMGTLALAGLSLCLLFSFLLVPTLVRPGCRSGGLDLPSRPRQGRGWAVAAWLLLLAAAGVAWPGLRFSGDLRQMDASGPRVRAAEAEFARTWGTSPAGEAVVGAGGSDLAAALDADGLAAEFLAGRGIAARSLSLVVPGPRLCARRLARWRRFWAGPGREIAAGIVRAGEKNGFSRAAFTRFLAMVDSPPPFARERMLASLPRAMRAFFIRDTATGPMVVSTVPAGLDRGTVAALRRLSPAIRVFAPGPWQKEMAGELRRETIAFSLRAVILVCVAALVFLRRLRPALAALVPVSAALAGMVLAVRASGGDLNLMHTLMGIMVCGLSIDYGIFAVCGPAGRAARPVSVCAASTVIGFGVFVLAVHPALRALGVTTLAGIGAAWPAALLVSPFVAGGRT